LLRELRIDRPPPHSLAICFGFVDRREESVFTKALHLLSTPELSRIATQLPLTVPVYTPALGRLPPGSRTTGLATSANGKSRIRTAWL